MAAFNYGSEFTMHVMLARQTQQYVVLLIVYEQLTPFSQYVLSVFLIRQWENLEITGKRPDDHKHDSIYYCIYINLSHHIIFNPKGDGYLLTRID